MIEGKDLGENKKRKERKEGRGGRKEQGGKIWERKRREKAKKRMK